MRRSQVRTPRLRWSILLSVALHGLAVIALNSVLGPPNVANAPAEPQAIRIFFPPTETSSELLQADVSPEMPQPGQRSDDLRPFLAQESEPNLPLDREQISESIPTQLSELPKPPEPRPPIDSPEVSSLPIDQKGQIPIRRRGANPLPTTPVNRPPSPPSPQRAPEANKLPGCPNILRILPISKTELNESGIIRRQR
jgi:hypothetical protein